MVATGQTTGTDASAVLPVNPDPVPADWQSLPQDKDGLRHAGKFTIYPNGLQVAPMATDADCIDGYSCWFENTRFNRDVDGWIRRMKDPTGSFITSNVVPGMSSWLNRNTRDAAWKDHFGGFHCMPNKNKAPANYNAYASPNDLWASYAIYGSGAVC